MADLIVGLVSLAAAAPGVAVALNDYGQFLSERISTFKNAPKEVRDLKKFGYSLYSGSLKLDVDLACNLCSQPGSDDSLKTSLDDMIQQLEAELATAKALLQKVDVNSVWGRGKLSLFGEKKIKKINKRLQEWQSQFLSFILLIKMKEATPKKSLLVARDQLRIRANYESSQSTILDESPCLVLSYAEVSDSIGPRDIPIMIEKLAPSDKTLELSELSEIASSLAETLATNPSTRGVLRCLGYRLEPGPELIFEVPRTLENPQTLRELISRDSGKPVSELHPIERRFNLARQLCEAVFSVHIAQFVHKRIRPEAILIFQTSSEKMDLSETESLEDQSLGSLFLTDWQLMRKASALSSRRGDSDWKYGLYRHPRRQGQQPQDRYNFGHDIYSLGVCLLEIGLWDSLIRNFDGKAIPSDKLRQAAESMDGPNANPSSLESKFKKPKEMQELLISLADKQLPPTMGGSYAELVISCITCLENGFGEGVDFAGDPVAAGVAFSNLILSSFATDL